jgi:hypothetical protein
MRPLTCLASESARIKGHADVAQCRVIVPVRSVVVPLVTTISKGAKWNKRADRGAESGALCHIAGAAVQVAPCQFIKPFTLDTVINWRESRPSSALLAVRDGAALVVATLEGGPSALGFPRGARSGCGGVHAGVVGVEEPASCLPR